MSDAESESIKKPGIPSEKNSEESWERDTLNRLAFATLNEQRRARRWGIFFKILGFIYLSVILFEVIYPNWQFDKEGKGIAKGKHTAVVHVEGIIATDSDANAETVISGLQSAFEDEDTKGVIIQINSPGGSPVQAGYINDEITRLRKKYKDIPVYAVVTDICASGGYYIAVAADKIYVDKASIVGSIGVLINSFGFVGTMEKIGAERRLFTAGESKGFLDPFLPIKESDKVHIESVLGNVHQQFINIVKTGRGKRLKNVDDPKLFSGLIWTGEQAIEIGLADDLGSSDYVAREIIKAEDIVDFTPKPNYLDRFAERFGATLAKVLSRDFLKTGNLQ
jgi:protease-4